jgi:uncharacterized protein YndB with AHSA1/START domain
MEIHSIELKQLLQAPIAHVYRAFTNAMALREWLCDIATVSPKPGGRFYLAWNDGYYTSGEYLIVEPERKVEFTWRGCGDPGETQVQVDLESQEDCTVLTLKHTGLESGEAWQNLAKLFEHEWKNSLENLVSVLEKGPDLRIIRRPMLGIFTGDFNAKQAKRLGVPVTEGVRLDGVLEGMGAHKAGLQKDDVITEIDGRQLKPEGELYQILSQHRAGDTLEVGFYRGSEKMKVSMTLSPRPIPEIAGKAETLVETLSKAYADAFASLEAVFEGVSEEQASHNPAPGEWNAKQVLAHFIHSERFNQFWITELVFAQERVSDGYGDNLPAQVNATSSVYDTIPDLLAELKRNQAEIIELIKGLPEEFVAQKSTFWRMAYALPEYPTHINAHLDQIRAAIASATH